MKHVTAGAMVLLLAGCGAGGGGMNLLSGGAPAARGWPVTYSDTTFGFAFVCKAGETCTERARAACKSPYRVRRLEEIDRSRSQLAVKGGLFRTPLLPRKVLTVSCR